jgi:hypothetical protein
MTTMWILGAVFTVVGLPFIWIARRAFAKDRVVAGWPRTDGVVTSATLQTSKERVTDKNTGLAHYRTVYTPSVRYTYSVNGQPFEGTVISRAADGMVTSQDTAQACIDKYPPQKQVTVLYDPADPKVAYLEVGRPIGAWILLVFGLVWIAVGVLLWALSFV